MDLEWALDPEVPWEDVRMVDDWSRDYNEDFTSECDLCRNNLHVNIAFEHFNNSEYFQTY